MTQTKEAQVTLPGDKALSRRCIKEMAVCESAVCANVLYEKERHGSALAHITASPQSLKLLPMEPTLNTEGAG